METFRGVFSASGFRFVYSSGPRSSPSLWVLAGDYILGSGQRDGGRAAPESGITSCRSTTPTLSHSKTFEERNRTNIKKETFVKSRFHRFRRRRSTSSSSDKLRCNLRRKKSNKNSRPLWQPHTNRDRRTPLPCLDPPPSPSHFLLVQRGISVKVEGAGSEAGTPHQVRPYLAVRQVGGVRLSGLMYKDVPQ